MKAGKEYELLIEKMYRELEPNAEITHDDHIYDDRAKITRQIDVSIKYKFAGVDNLIIVQAKDYKIKADIKIVDQFQQVIEDVNANKGILICSKGFSTAALNKAKSYGIECLTVHSAVNKKWETLLQIPVSKTIHYFAFASDMWLDVAHKAGKNVTLMHDTFSYNGYDLIRTVEIINDHIIKKMGWHYIKTQKKIKIDLKKIGLFHGFDKEMLPVDKGFFEIQYMKSELQNFLIKPVDYIYTSDHINNVGELHNLTIDEEILSDILDNEHIHDHKISDKPIISAVIYKFLSDHGETVLKTFKFNKRGGIKGHFFLKGDSIYHDDQINRDFINFEQTLKGLK